MSQDKMPLGQNVTGQNVTGHNVTGQKVTGQNVTGQNVTGQKVTRQNATLTKDRISYRQKATQPKWHVIECLEDKMSQA